jgi:hypothetical protein
VTPLNAYDPEVQRLIAAGHIPRRWMRGEPCQACGQPFPCRRGLRPLQEMDPPIDLRMRWWIAAPILALVAAFLVLLISSL